MVRESEITFMTSAFYKYIKLSTVGFLSFVEIFSKMPKRLHSLEAGEERETFTFSRRFIKIL